MNELLLTFLVSLIIQIIIFIPAFIFKTDKLTDLSYGLTFIILAFLVFITNTFSFWKLVLLIMIVVWGLRIALYLFKRIIKMGRDKRFDNIRTSFVKFLGFWILQGITVWVVLLATILFFMNKTIFKPLVITGLIIWIIGFLIEAISDHQKHTFKNNPKNKGKWIETGLWKYSRHPNYFGEITCWFGIYLFTLSSLPGFYKLLALISPVYIAFLIIFVSGLPKLEKSADKKWGQNKAYLEYKKRTSILVPLPNKLK